MPHTAGVRVPELDELCEEIGTWRTKKNQAINGEASAKRDALGSMIRHKKRAYRHDGIELARIPGAEELRVRLTKETGDAATDDSAETAPAEIEVNWPIDAGADADAEVRGA